MNSVAAFFKRLGLCLVIFGIAYLIIISIPGMKALDINIHGWGWAILVANSFVFAVGLRYAERYVSAKATGSWWEQRKTAAIIVRPLLDWIVMALALFTTVYFAPSLANYSSATLVVVLSILVGVISGLYDVIAKRLFGGK